MIIILKLKKLIHKIHYIDDIGSVKISVIANFTFNFNFLPPIIFTCYLTGSLDIFFFFSVLATLLMWEKSQEKWKPTSHLLWKLKTCG